MSSRGRHPLFRSYHEVSIGGLSSIYGKCLHLIGGLSAQLVSGLFRADFEAEDAFGYDTPKG